MKIIEIYTDGACSGNPGQGGLGIVIKIEQEIKLINKGFKNTTNNRMELRACIEALKFCQKFYPQNQIKIFTDSTYVQKGICEWIITWKKNGFKSTQKKAIKNQDLWQSLDQLNNEKISWHWIKGHSGNFFNEKADRLAVEALKGQDLQDDLEKKANLQLF